MWLYVRRLCLGGVLLKLAVMDREVGPVVGAVAERPDHRDEGLDRGGADGRQGCHHHHRLQVEEIEKTGVKKETQQHDLLLRTLSGLSFFFHDYL